MLYSYVFIFNTILTSSNFTDFYQSCTTLRSRIESLKYLDLIVQKIFFHSVYNLTHFCIVLDIHMIWSESREDEGWLAEPLQREAEYSYICYWKLTIKCMSLNTSLWKFVFQKRPPTPRDLDFTELLTIWDPLSCLQEWTKSFSSYTLTALKENNEWTWVSQGISVKERGKFRISFFCNTEDSLSVL